MANAKTKITLSPARDIPFNRLVLAQTNVRRVKAGVSIEELAASIARRGLIQSLHVRPLLDEAGADTGQYEVPAGGRRFRALELLVKQKRLAKTAPVPCIVGDAASEVLSEEISLAENVERAPLHPLDQYRAFEAMRAKGMTEEAIAAAFFVPAQIVRQRLRLAAVAPELLDAYGEDAMTLEHLMAFTVTDDQDRQRQVWEAVQASYSRTPQQIRRLLTETAVRASDRRALFVGIEAYEAAGGRVLRDLFEEDHGGWLQDPTLLGRLVAEKLAAAAEEVAAEGWKWTETEINFPYGHTFSLREIDGDPVDLTEDEVAARAALAEEYDRLETEHAQTDEYPEEVDRRLGEIETALEAFDQRPMRFDPADIAIAGAFISIDPGGRLQIDRGYVRPEDEPAADKAEPDGDVTDEDVVTTVSIDGEGAPAEEPEEEDDTGKPLPERLTIELTAHRTLALRDALAAHPRIAMTALLHKLVLDSFSRALPGAALEARVSPVCLPVQGEGLADSLPARMIEEREEAWKADIPLAEGDDAVWDWLDRLDEASRLALLAHCVSFGVNALFERPNPYGTGISASGLERRMREADRLARVTGLDMAEAGWTPTVATYLGRVTKARILEAVREGAGEGAAARIEGLKKDAMAKAAEELLAGTGWLPTALRTPGDPPAEEAPAEDEKGAAAVAAE